MADVVVIGAGIAGLSAAHRLLSLGADVRVVESSARVGGHLSTVRRAGWRHELGPNSFIGRATAMFDLADELGLKPVEARPVSGKRYLFLDGALRALPTNPLVLLASSLVPASAKVRLLTEPLRSPPVRDDESVHEFFSNRLGPDFTNRFVDAFCSGIYAADITRLGMEAAFPQVFQATRDRGSLVRGLASSMKSSGTAPRRRGTWSFAGGLGDLADALSRRLEGRIDLSMDVTLERENGAWRVGPHRAEQVILATPAPVSADLVESHAALLASELRAVRYNPVVGVHVLLKRDDVPMPLDGFGFLVPRNEGLRLLGVIWSSALFDVCPPDCAALTCILGGGTDPTLIDASDEEIITHVRDDLRRSMGIQASPLDVSIVRIRRGIPEYQTDHVQHRARMELLFREQQGLTLAGNYLEGVSMNDTILAADRAAREVFERLGGRRTAS